MLLYFVYNKIEIYLVEIPNLTIVNPEKYFTLFASFTPQCLRKGHVVKYTMATRHNVKFYCHITRNSNKLSFGI